MDIVKTIHELDERDDEDAGSVRGRRKRKRRKKYTAKQAFIEFAGGILAAAALSLFLNGLPLLFGCDPWDANEYAEAPTLELKIKAFQKAMRNKELAKQGLREFTVEHDFGDTVITRTYTVKVDDETPTTTPKEDESHDDDNSDTEREDSAVSGVISQDDAQRILQEWGLG